MTSLSHIGPPRFDLPMLLLYSLFCGDSEDGEEVFYDYYLNGLPKSGAGDKKRVVIVGAGISGLTAAKMLRDAGHDIVVLESTNRVGGRIQTYRHEISVQRCSLLGTEK